MDARTCARIIRAIEVRDCDDVAPRISEARVVDFRTPDRPSSLTAVLKSQLKIKACVIWKGCVCFLVRILVPMSMSQILRTCTPLSQFIVRNIKKMNSSFYHRFER